MSLNSKRICLLCFLLLLPSLAVEQDQSKPPLTFTSRSELVSVPVVVVNKKGDHVSGLTKDEFELKEDGKTKAIATFEEIQSTVNRPHHPAVQPDVYTNELSNDASPKRLTIFALDQVNTPFMDQHYAREQLMQYLASRVDSHEPISVVAIRANGIRVLHDFTADPAALVAALKKASGDIPSVRPLVDNSAVAGMANSNDAAIDADFRTLSAFASAEGEYVALAEREAILVTLECFQHVAEAFAGVPGRKSLIWATAAFPFRLDPVSGRILAPSVVNVTLNQAAGNRAGPNGRLPTLPSSAEIKTGEAISDLEPVYQRTLQMLSDANISVYPVDARGLIVFFPGANVALSGNPRQTQGSQLESFTQSRSSMFEATRETMEDFAKRTGGKAFYNRNDLDVAFRKAADDSSTYYLLGYYLDQGAKAGWHKLQVKTKRGGVDVRARDGFFVSAPMTKDETMKMDLKMALASPLDYTGVPLSVSWKQSVSDGNSENVGKKKIHFQMLLPASAHVVDTTSNNLVDLAIVVEARAPNGTPVDHFAQHVRTSLKPESLQILQKAGLNYGNDLLLAPGEYSVRFVVQNFSDGRMGTVTAPLQVSP